MSGPGAAVLSLGLRPASSERVTIVNDGRTVMAKRNYKEFNHGLVFSASPLPDDHLFQLHIDKKINTWSGSIEIGVITCDPSTIDPSTTATTLVDGSWVMSGNLILKNGAPYIQINGKDLNTLKEGDTIGVMKTSSGDLIFEVCGECIGIVTQNLPNPAYAVIDLYGKCVQVTMKTMIEKLQCQNHNSDKSGWSCPILTPNVPYFSNLQLCPDLNVHVNLPSKTSGQGAIPKERYIKTNSSKLRFHQHCGSLVKLSSDRKSAERRDPLDEFNNGVVMTHRALYDDELFEIRIDHLVNKWSGSLEVGVTTHNPLLIEFPSTMTNMHSGTIMMSGCGILINGKGTRREYGQFNLDELREGDRVGMMRKSNGNLHYFINALDQGMAASKISQHVYGVIDLYGMTIKVTIIDPEERKVPNSITPRKFSQSNSITHGKDHGEPSRRNFIIDLAISDRLLFHSNCGAHAVVSNGGLTAHRPRATDDFNNGVVLTNRPLRPGEIFEVRLEKVVKKWAGSIEIGVTTHTPNDLEFPITMTNMRSGTWMMTGNGVMHNGTTVQDRYGSSLDRIIVGDRVGVVRQSCGTLHFYINGVDQGPATAGVPENVYGVIDLYGQAAQASIVQFPNSPESLPSSISNTTLHGGDLCFHRVHGRNVRVQGIGLVATRIASMVNFEDALLFSSRPLRECEMFQIRISDILDLCDSCIAFGVTAACPSEIAVPSTFKNITQDTYILHGRTLIHNGCYMSDKYSLNLQNISVNSRVGVMRHADRSVHFYLDGMDQGKAWDVYNLNIYAVIDMSGQCSEVCMSPPKSRGFSGNSDNSLNMPTTGLQCSHITKHIFSEYCGSNIEINSDYTVARVISLTTMSNLVFSASLLHPDGLFEVEVMSCDNNFAGSMRIGVTDVNILNAYVNSKLPSSMLDLPPGTMYIEGNQQMTIGSPHVNVVYPSLNWLKTKDRVGLRRIGYSDCIALQLNTEEINVVFRNVPDKVFVVFEMCGSQTSIKAVSTESFPCADGEMEASDDGNSLHLIGCASPVQLNNSINASRCNSPDHNATLANMTSENVKQPPDVPLNGHKKLASFFHINHGGNVVIEKQGIGVRRLNGYNRAIVIANKPIIRGQCFKFQVTKTNLSWSSSIMVGVSKSALALRLPTSAVDLKQGCWIVSGDHLYLDGNVIWSDYGKPLDMLRSGAVIILDFTENRELHLIVNDVNLGCFSRMTQKVNKLYPIIDIYGQCEQVSILNDEETHDFEADLSDSDDIAINLVKPNILPNVICAPGDTILEHNSNNNSEYYKTIQLCEKAYLEYYEKESSNPNRNNLNNGHSSQSSISFQTKGKISKQQLSKSLSENESFNLAIQNISMSESANATNEIKNREIKRRTTIVNCYRPNNNASAHDQACSIWSFTPFDDQYKRDYAFHRSTTLPHIPKLSQSVRRSTSHDNVSNLTPKTLMHLCDVKTIQYTSDLNTSLIKLWKLWELWKQCKQQVLSHSLKDNEESDNSTASFKDSCKFVFSKCRGQVTQSVKDLYESSQVDDPPLSMSDDTCISSSSKIQCTLSKLYLSVDFFKGAEPSARKSSLCDDHEYYIRLLFKETPAGYIPGDDFIYYIRELFRESPKTYDCSILSNAIDMKELLGLPDFLFTDDPPQCFCNACCPSEMITDIPHGWVRFFLNKSGRSPDKTKRKLRYWMINIDDIQHLLQVGPDPGLPQGNAFIVPCEKLQPPDRIDNSHLRCFDKRHLIGEMRAALEVFVWNPNDVGLPEDICQTYNVKPIHYFLDCVGYCQVQALLLCEST
ncbi:neuralized E3 ubiquitin protein ligase 4 [Arctopsyche grandis]|uniref:neuralized E3 ubiquitin protein ligase 4 n=1 Tax=Arctopsyche grandis TaxID=121162 RepID=UPI00406D72F3